MPPAIKRRAAKPPGHLDRTADGLGRSSVWKKSAEGATRPELVGSRQRQ